ncbi:MAG: LytTR family DNA-binding domain-containing protein [Myxococcota bacterium]|nr:LytTR family DNA-binding domain-containing protein [Myxococcota bacterium]
MSTIRALVVDDEPLARDELVFTLEQIDGVEVAGQAESTARALALIAELEPDVVFADLRMPGPDGLALAEAILARRPGTAIVMVSAHDDGALRGFEVGVVDYLLKPARLERVRKAVERVRTRITDAAAGDPTTPRSDAPLTRLAVRRRGAYVVVDIGDVIWLEVKDELVWAVTKDDRFALDLTLAALEQRLPEGVFFRSHRGYLVRLDRIAAIEPSGAGTFELTLEHPDKPRIPLARERARLLRDLIPIAG